MTFQVDPFLEIPAPIMVVGRIVEMSIRAVLFSVYSSVDLDPVIPVDRALMRLKRVNHDDNRILDDYLYLDLALGVVGIVMVVRYPLLMLYLIYVFHSVGNLVR